MFLNAYGNIDTIVSRDGKYRGKPTSVTIRNCGVEGCFGLVLRVKWNDGKVSFPCTAGLRNINSKKAIWKIL